MAGKIFLAILALTLLLISFIRLEAAPPVWWDEGWTLLVARNWVENGHYGQLNNGIPQSTGFSAAFPVITPVALSFRLFGVGIWQGRLPGLFFTFASLGLAAALAAQAYSRRVAAGTIGFLLLMLPGQYLHPILIGRQVLGEMPMLFYLLAGYVFLFLAIKGRSWWILPAVACWGLGVRAKGQPMPFWLISMLLPLAVAALRRWRRPAILLIIGLLGGWLAAQAITPLEEIMVRSPIIRGEPLVGYFGVTALVLDWAVRLGAWRVAFTIGLPVVIGLGYAAWNGISGLRLSALKPECEIIRWSLLGFSGAWFAWYILLASVPVRYLFPALFTGSIFAADLLMRLTSDFNLRLTVHQASALLLNRKLAPRNAGALLGIVLIGGPFILTILSLPVYYTIGADEGVRQAAGYINAQTPPEALVESYDSELFFLLHRRYHFPPDQVSVELMRKMDLRQAVAIDYDPLAADPDYLVVGPFSDRWQLYTHWLESGDFELLTTFSAYRIYARVRDE